MFVEKSIARAKLAQLLGGGGRLSQSVATWQRRCEAQHILRGTKW